MIILDTHRLIQTGQQRNFGEFQFFSPHFAKLTTLKIKSNTQSIKMEVRIAYSRHTLVNSPRTLTALW